MAKTRYIQNSFLSGELSPLVKGNITLAQYYQGLEQAKNVMVVPQGGVKRRGGLKYVATNAAGSAIFFVLQLETLPFILLGQPILY